MNMLSEIVKVSRRYQRSVRIDTDYTVNGALQDYVFHGSSHEAIETMARLFQETGQRALHLDRSLWWRQVEPRIASLSDSWPQCGPKSG